MNIKEIKYLKDYEIEIIYDNGVTHIFNLEPVVKEFISKYNRFTELLDHKYFATVHLNKDWNTIEWDNGFDICPDYFQPANTAA
jgi:hypothetical protein